MFPPNKSYGIYSILDGREIFVNELAENAELPSVRQFSGSTSSPSSPQFQNPLDSTFLKLDGRVIWNGRLAQ